MAIDKTDSDKHYKEAQSHFNVALHDNTDPASENLLRGLHNYFYAVISYQVQIGKELEAIMKRLDKLEKAPGK